MKICVFGAASAHIDKKYIERAEEFGQMMAARGHSLVFGAGATGLMGAAARGVKRGGGFITGIIPEFFRVEGVELIYKECDFIIYTESMAERKRRMEEEADAFVILPGGIGTLEEFLEVLTLKQLARFDKPIAIYNVDGYFDGFESFMATVEEEKFVNFNCRALYKYFKDADALLSYVEGYIPTNTPWQKMKAGE